MCGIAGLYNPTGAPVESALLQDMTRRLAHRGPDGEGFWIKGSVGFGHRRLAVRDVSDAGRQPFTDPDEKVVVLFNGEIYNDAALRLELQRDFGYRFRTHCDTEVIPAGYLAWGEALFERLQGMFAIALWDVGRQRLLLARDPVGIKPLYITSKGAEIRFASEAKAFLADPQHPRAWDPEALHLFMAQGYVSPERTLQSEVTSLSPGTLRFIDAQGMTERRYWRPKRTGEIKTMPEAVEAFGASWKEVIRDTLLSDVPVGVLQSGGIDSSLVSLQLRATGKQPPLFTAKFDQESHDETPLARQVAEDAGLPHHVIAVERDPATEKTFEAIVHHTDGELADSSAYPLYRLCREVRRQVTVALSGDGADEFFGGYPTYRASRMAVPLQGPAVQAVARRAAPWFLDHSSGDEARVSFSEKLGRFLQGLAAPRGESHAWWRRLLPTHEMKGLYGPALKPFLDQNPLAFYGAAVRQSSGSLVDRCLQADQSFYLPSDMLVKVDRMSMAHGLEIRVPFLDRRMLDLAARMDANLLTPFRGPDKKILRRVLELQEGRSSIVTHRKMGFNHPVARWLRTELRELGDELLERRADRLMPYFEPAGVRHLWREHASGGANHGYVLWSLLTLAVRRRQLEG